MFILRLRVLPKYQAITLVLLLVGPILSHAALGVWWLFREHPWEGALGVLPWTTSGVLFAYLSHRWTDGGRNPLLTLSRS